MPDNPNDSYDLVLQTNPAAPLYEQKQRLWSLGGLDSTCTVPITLNDPLPSKVLRYLRIQRLEESDIADMTLKLFSGTDEKVNHSNETQILEFLVASIGAILESFAIPLEKLEAQLTAGAYPAGGNSWAAAQVSLGEQKVLRLAKKRATESLEALEDAKSSLPSLTQCAKCGDGSAQLMLCSRCKSVKYCGRECQVGHFKDHKAMCKAVVAGNGAK